MIRRPPRSTRTDTHCPYPTLFRTRCGATIEDAEYADADTEFFDDIVKGTLARAEEIDAAIVARLASGWSMDRLDRTMKAILRAGTYELIARGDVPVGAVVSEYVDVAKADRKSTRLNSSH